MACRRRQGHWPGIPRGHSEKFGLPRARVRRVWGKRQGSYTAHWQLDSHMTSHHTDKNTEADCQCWRKMAMALCRVPWYVGAMDTPGTGTCIHHSAAAAKSLCAGNYRFLSHVQILDPRYYRCLSCRRLGSIRSARWQPVYRHMSIVGARWRACEHPGASRPLRSHACS